MECLAARRMLRDVRGPQAASSVMSEAFRHLNRCEACRAWDEAERGWRETLRDRLPAIETPLHVRERLFASLGEARVGAVIRRQRGRWASALALVTVLFASLGGLWWWREVHHDGFLAAALAEDHLLYAARPDPAEYRSNDPAAVSSWFAERVDFAVGPMSLPSAELLGGRLCTLADRRAALWLYRSGDRRVSLFQMQAQGLPLGSFRRMTVAGRSYLCGRRKGVSVLAWTSRDVLFALVSDLPEGDLLRLVRF